MDPKVTHRPHIVQPEEATVLVIEDNLMNLEALEFMLKELMKVRYYNARASGLWLFRWLEENPDKAIDLILLDLQIPREDGFKVHAQLRQIQRDGIMREQQTKQRSAVKVSALHHTRIIAVTADIMQEIVERCRKEGFDGFIGKPTRPQRFPDQIRRILAGEGVWEPQ